MVTDKASTEGRDDATAAGGRWLGRLFGRLARRRKPPARETSSDLSPESGGDDGTIDAPAAARGRDREEDTSTAAASTATSAAGSNPVLPGPTVYAGAHEHLAEELSALDLRIRQQVLEQRHGLPENPWEQLKGLVLSEEEITALTTEEPANGRPDSGAGPLVEAHSRFEEISRFEKSIERRRAESLEQGVLLTLPHLARLFQLSRFEEQIVLICLAPELDRKYDKLYAYLQDDVTRKRPSVDLALRLLGLSWKQRLTARSLFDPQAPLLKYRLLELLDVAPDGPQPLLARSLKLDDRIVDLLLANQRIDARLEPAVRLADPADEDSSADLPEELADRMRGFTRCQFVAAEAPRDRVLCYVQGPYGSGRRALAAAAAGELGLPLLLGDLERLSGADQLWLAARESFLQPAVLCLEPLVARLAAGRAAELTTLLAATESLSQLTFLLGGGAWRPRGRLREGTFIALELDKPDDGARARLWQSRLADERLAEEIDPGPVAGTFRFTPGEMRDAVAAARDLARWRSPGEALITRRDLYAACRSQSNPELVSMARKIEPRYRWRDIVLPDDPRGQLREICDQARYRHVVLGDWGFDRKLSYGKGLAALFSGPPGTGKTMAAEVVAGDLGLDLYKIDLSQVVSKYIGETEKNLDRIFNAAEHANAILFFDEADALFGKRSEVRDSHDRYANVEISYLLQKMEEYEGISILATNLRQHMDDAFLRRLQSIVEFPFPDAADRERIWRVTFPRETPLGDDVDFAALGRELRLAGGNIKNIGLQAAFYAAADGGTVGMPHLLEAARREHQKLGRNWNRPVGLPKARGAEAVGAAS